MFKTQGEPRAAGEWFDCKVLNVLWHHFHCLGKTLESGGRFVFYNNIYIYEKSKTKQPALHDLCHFHGLCSHRP